MQYADVDEQLASREVSRTKFGEGSMYFIRGLAKKVLLANTSGMIFTEVSGLAKGNIAVMTAWLGAFAYMFQIYFDFSGYSDMAIGLGKMFGFEFNMNFNYPYVSKSITEFWRRWHIFAEQLVQGLCVYSIGRKQGIEDQTHQESSDRMVSDRIMAWSCMEFRGMGTLLWGDPDH